MIRRAVLVSSEAAGDYLPIVGVGMAAAGGGAGGVPACGEGPAHAAGGRWGPSLDIKDINTKRGASAAGNTWTRQQKRVRRVCLDRLRYWQAHGYAVLWVTLTSGVPEDGASPMRGDGRGYQLKEDFQELRRRVADRWNMSPFEYVCIETAEGHGVLHMLWAARVPKAQFYIPYTWLSKEWARVHGAWSVWVARVVDSEKSRRRLSRYIVSQYCGGQDALVRVSQSRLGFAFGKCRKALLKALRDCTDRYLYYGRIKEVFAENLGRVCGQWFFLELRYAWQELLERGECVIFGHRLCWFLGELCEV